MTNKVFKSFRPANAFTFVMGLCTLLFVTLGVWQTQRAEEKLASELQHSSATDVTLEKAMAQENRFSRIEVSGHFDTSRHLLLDNQIWQGRAGVYVFTPFYTVNGNKLLVNRGWLPLAADRKTLPDIPTPEQEVVLRGMLNRAPVPGRILGSADHLSTDQWPQLVTYLSLEDISRSLEVPLEDWIIQLSENEENGFEGRQWKAVFLSSSRHSAYAFQWFALAAAAVIMWLVVGFKHTSGNRK